MTTLALRDQIPIIINVPDDIDSMTLGDIARAVTLILEITIAILIILARVVIIGWYIGRGVLDVWLKIATFLCVNPFIWVADRALSHGRYWQGG